MTMQYKTRELEGKMAKVILLCHVPDQFENKGWGVKAEEFSYIVYFHATN